MGGGLMQLVAYGSQDVYLTGNPQITFFKAVYKRHTNFAMECIQQVFNGTPTLGQKSSVTISRNGDLVHEVFLKYTGRFTQVPDATAGAYSYPICTRVLYPALPGVSSGDSDEKPLHKLMGETVRASWPAEAYVSEVELSIGGQSIDKHTREWFRLRDELYHNETQKSQYAKMTCVSDSQMCGGAAGCGDHSGGVDDKVAQARKTNLPAGELYLPLKFSFNVHPGLALPLIALQYHEVKLDVTFATQGDSPAVNIGVGDAANSLAAGDVEMWCNYIYLDTDERRKFAQNQHEYLIEQLQIQQESFTTAVAGGSSQNIRLNFNHPVKELVWCIPRNKNFPGGSGAGHALTQAFDPVEALNAEAGPWGNFSYAAGVRRITGSLASGGFAVGAGQTQQSSFFAVTNSGAATGKEHSISCLGLCTTVVDRDVDSRPQLVSGGAIEWGTGGRVTNDGETPGAQYDASILASNSSMWERDVPLESISGTVTKFKLQLNGHDRFSEQSGTYFNQVQPAFHHSGRPTPGVYCYSFALKPENHQPSGSCNFSRIDNATAVITRRSGEGSQSNSTLKLYAVNYNVLRIMSGMGGLAYSN